MEKTHPMVDPRFLHLVLPARAEPPPGIVLPKFVRGGMPRFQITAPAGYLLELVHRPSLIERQKALVATHPGEYVVLRGDVVLAHTADKDEAFRQFEAAFDESSDPEPIVVPPAALRDPRPPVLRGRAIRW